MTIALACPQCGVQHSVADKMRGKRARCTCGATLSVPRDQPPPADPTSFVVRCPGCGKHHRTPASMAGKRARCSCSAVLQIPTLSHGAGGGLSPHAPLGLDDHTAVQWQPLPQVQPQPQQKDAAPRQRSEEEVLSQYLESDRWREEVAASNTEPDYDGAFGFEKRIFNGGVLIGLAAMAGAVVWFVAGLACGIIFFYPPILFVIGLISLLRGLLTGQ